MKENKNKNFIMEIMSENVIAELKDYLTKLFLDEDKCKLPT